MSFLDTNGVFPNSTIVKDHVTDIMWKKGTRKCVNCRRYPVPSVPWYKVLWLKYHNKPIPWEFGRDRTGSGYMYWETAKVYIDLSSGECYEIECNSNKEAKEYYDLLNEQLDKSPCTNCTSSKE